MCFSVGQNVKIIPTSNWGEVTQFKSVFFFFLRLVTWHYGSFPAPILLHKQDDIWEFLFEKESLAWPWLVDKPALCSCLANLAPYRERGYSPTGPVCHYREQGALTVPLSLPTDNQFVF